jgi:polysaccharide biosynthesis protein PslH
MARVLWLTAQVPDRDLGGGNIRQAHLLAAASSVHEVHLAVVGSLRDDGLRRSLAGVTELPVPPAQEPLRGYWRRAAHARSFVQRAPEDCVNQSEARAALRPVAEGEADFDIVCVEHGALGPLLPERRRATWTVTLHYLASRQADQLRRVSTGLAARSYWAREAGKARRAERWIAASYDRTFVCSDDDAARLVPRAEVVPNGVDLEAFGTGPLPSQPSIVFTGSLDYRPNLDGLQWFCDSVLPLVRDEVPDATLQIVGHRPSPAVRALALRPEVQLHADVPSVEPFVLGSRVAVVPLRIGSGTRLKALEAMAARRPVVGTTIGLAGLGLVDGVHARIVDDRGGFASAVIDALEGRRVAAMVADARRLVEERFSWSSIGRDYAARLTALASAPATERA